MHYPHLGSRVGGETMAEQRVNQESQARVNQESQARQIDCLMEAEASYYHCQSYQSIGCLMDKSYYGYLVQNMHCWRNQHYPDTWYCCSEWICKDLS